MGVDIVKGPTDEYIEQHMWRINKTEVWCRFIKHYSKEDVFVTCAFSRHHIRRYREEFLRMEHVPLAEIKVIEPGGIE